MNQMLGLAPGAAIASDGRRYVITHILSLEAILAKDQETGQKRGVKALRHYVAAAICFAEDRDQRSHFDRAEGLGQCRALVQQDTAFALSAANCRDG